MFPRRMSARVEREDEHATTMEVRVGETSYVYEATPGLPLGEVQLEVASDAPPATKPGLPIGLTLRRRWTLSSTLRSCWPGLIWGRWTTVGCSSTPWGWTAS